MDPRQDLCTNQASAKRVGAATETASGTDRKLLLPDKREKAMRTLPKVQDDDTGKEIRQTVRAILTNPPAYAQTVSEPEG